MYYQKNTSLQTSHTIYTRNGEKAFDKYLLDFHFNLTFLQKYICRLSMAHMQNTVIQLWFKYEQ